MPKKIYRDKVTKQRVEKEVPPDGTPAMLRRSRTIGMKTGKSSTNPSLKLRNKTVVNEKKYAYVEKQNHLDVTIPDAKKKQLKYV
jgi:hypothetical protein